MALDLASNRYASLLDNKVETLEQLYAKQVQIEKYEDLLKKLSDLK